MGVLKVFFKECLPRLLTLDLEDFVNKSKLQLELR